MDKRPWQLKPEEEDVSSYRHFELVDLEQVFAANPHAKIINSDSSVTKNLAKDMTDIIFSNCDGDLGFVPSCQCGNTKGVSKLGLKCPLCPPAGRGRSICLACPPVLAGPGGQFACRHRSPRAPHSWGHLPGIKKELPALIFKGFQM